jgi:DNA-directed RNA polymerase subunit RPC12/RpoP
MSKDDWLCGKAMDSHNWERLGGCRKKCSRCGAKAYDHNYAVTEFHMSEDSSYKYACKTCGHRAMENSNIDSREKGFLKPDTNS